MNKVSEIKYFVDNIGILRVGEIDPITNEIIFIPIKIINLNN